MGRSSSFHMVLLVLSLLVLSFTHGLGRKLTEIDEHKDSSTAVETAGISKETVGMMDYDEPQPNTNPKNGYIISPPPRPN
ncbi:Serrate RNA effector molecule like [Quillaja saponaria]|uniref:Serrate RNA effector molecule like n=1 Tax=Quillaja saponaria TaxID=32244 RepID=A0AAD7PXI5_QUISA|nr:Serrate RNA effector molecule like [Quillaja saponaria]